jgi:hypothetical protein
MWRSGVKRVPRSGVPRESTPFQIFGFDNPDASLCALTSSVCICVCVGVKERVR